MPLSWPARLPINDVVRHGGSDGQGSGYLLPGSRVAGGAALTDKCESRSEEELAALFTYFNWMFTEEGSDFHTFGLERGSAGFRQSGG